MDVGDQIVIRAVDNWQWLPKIDLWNVIELLLIVFAMGFVIGYMCAVKSERARSAGAGNAKPNTNAVGTQSRRALRRTIGTQSQCTYKRKIVTPRFHVLPDQADGVFDVSFPGVYPEDVTEPGSVNYGRPKCACQCGCRRSPGRRIICPKCEHHVGPGCCWVSEVGLCHRCALSELDHTN